MVEEPDESDKFIEQFRIRQQRSFSHDRAIRDDHRSGTSPRLCPVAQAMDTLRFNY